MYTIQLSEEAEMEVLEAFLFYENKVQNLGIAFEEEVDHAIKEIVKNPFLFQIKHKNCRVHFLKKFPFGIHYFIQENDIKIIAIFHTSRNPIRWKLRE